MSRTSLIFFALFLALALDLGAEVSSRPLPAPTPDQAIPLYERIPATASGVDFICPIDRTHPLKRIYVSGFACGGVAVGDINGDDRPDLFLVNGPGENKLFQQTGDFQFKDVTATSGLAEGKHWAAGAAFADIDNDGDLDLYLCHYEAPNLLYLNDGKGKFREAAREYGLDYKGSFLMAAFADYDRDGDLDLYLLGHRHYRAKGRPAAPPTVIKDATPVVKPEFQKYYGLLMRGNKLDLNEIGVPDRLLRNDRTPDGKVRFTDVSVEAGLTRDPDQGNGVLWFDYDHDGWPDLFVGNDFESPDRLYRNNRNGTFSEVIRTTLPHTTWFSMGSDCADINNDGLIDFLSLDMAGTTHYKSKTTMGIMGASTWFMLTADPPQYMRNCMFVNTGTGKFLETAFQSHTANSDWSWAAKFGDLDCDGRSDLFISNGIVRNLNDSDRPVSAQDLVGRTEWDLFENRPPRPEKNLALQNKGDFAFKDRSDEWGLGSVGMSYAAAHADLNRDGFLDLVVANLDEPVGIYRNRGNAAHRILIRLKGTRSNRYGIGAEVEVDTAAGKQIRQFNPMRGFASCDDPVIHFGLGAEKVIKTLTVRWPSGIVQTLRNLAPNREYTITEEGVAQPEKQPEVAPPLFASSSATRGIKHWEMPFDDFKAQPLLPNRLSSLGPGLACADVNNDGREDLFLGGCAGYQGQLLLRNAQGDLDASPFPGGLVHRNSEDMGALFFDANGDGRQDLYVVSGSVETTKGAATYSDRLYLNFGPNAKQAVQFRAAASTVLPPSKASGSIVTACDFDRDGDLDLFVGGRVVPGEYPLPAQSRLLVNDSKGRLVKFTDQTAKLAPKLAKAGLVTGALWSDANNDGWVDLLVTYEWGPVRLFLNQRGQLVDQTEKAGLNQWTGWWTGISSGDFDHDGDLDYVATNFGLNTKYHPTTETPELLFYGDFQGTGNRTLVEAKFEQGKCYPHRGFSCSRNAMPFLKSKMKSFHNFAEATLPELYTEQRLEDSYRVEANTLASGIFSNNGDGTFTFSPLPALAQVSPSFGSAVTDFDGDGHLDICLAQNFFGPQVETRPMDSGLSIFLRGAGDGSFGAVWPKESGLIITEDAKSLVLNDLNNDGRPDIIIGTNDGPVLAFQNTTSTENSHLVVRLQAKGSNKEAIGARVTLLEGDSRRQTQEVTAGSGYLSQSGPRLYFGTPNSTKTRKLRVRWPDGSSSTFPAPAKSGRVLLRQPTGKTR